MLDKSMFFQIGQSVTVPKEADVVFVSDLFASEYTGGAELTSEALILSSPLSVFRVHSRDVSLETLQSGHQKFWIFGNFSGLNPDIIPTIIANMRYSVLEFDFKVCRHRSLQKHLIAENKPCDCHTSMTGKMVSAFYFGAKSLWWMSEKQQETYLSLFPFLGEIQNDVLSSVFSPEFFLYINQLREKYKNTPRDKWLVIGSQSWIKGTEDSVNHCIDNNLDYDIVWNLPYDQLLDKLAQSKGLVFLPRGSDTCPRTVIEAKLLGCELVLNENVQHRDEIWFDTDDMFDTEAYLFAARERFWNGIRKSMDYNPSLSGYTTTYNCVTQNYPFVESITSLLGFCDEVVVVDGGSTDGTVERLAEIAKGDSRLVVHVQKRDWNHPRSAVFDGQQKALARSICKSEWCWQMDVDEIVHETDYKKVRDLVKTLPKGMELVSLPIIEYWGGKDKVRADIHSWKWRLSQNKPYITHGIPSQFRKFDSNGDLYALKGTDGCDYIRNDSYDVIPHSSFYTQDVDVVRCRGMTDPESLKAYEQWLNQIVEEIPTVYHFSWFNIQRKVLTYKSFWSVHWERLFNIKTEDTAENNMFFDKPWKDVTDDEINDIAKRLASEMGGWIFHRKVDFSKKTPWIKIDKSPPSIMTEWMKSDKN